MLVIDSQIHLWTGGRAPPHHRQSPYTAQEAVADMAAAGIDAAINHPPGWDPDSNAYAIEAAGAFPAHFATLGWLKLDRPDAPERVRRWRTQPGMIGLRFICAEENERSWPTDGTMDWLWPLAEELNLPIALCGPFLLPHVERIAAGFPNLKLAIDHLGFVGFTADHGLIQAPGLLDWARFPNVSVKLTGAPDYAPDAYPFKSMHTPIRRLYDCFGPERLFWGSDITRLKCTWRQSLTMFTEEMPWLSEADKSLLVGESFCRWAGWRPRSASVE